MALQLPTYTTEHGIDLQDVYCRIDSFRGNRHQVRLNVGVYVSKSKRDEQKPAIASLEFTMDTPNTSGNMFADVYTHLKTLPEFNGHSDI